MQDDLKAKFNETAADLTKIGAENAASLLTYAAQQIEAFEERLRTAMIREQDIVKQAQEAIARYQKSAEDFRAEHQRRFEEQAKQLADLTRERDDLRRTVATMKEHPDVKAAELARLREQHAALADRIGQLAPSE